MSQVVGHQCKELHNAEINRIIVDGCPRFQAKDVATILGFVNSRKAVLDHVDDDDKCKYSALVASHAASRIVTPLERFSNYLSTPWFSGGLVIVITSFQKVTKYLFVIVAYVSSDRLVSVYVIQKFRDLFSLKPRITVNNNNTTNFSIP